MIIMIIITNIIMVVVMVISMIISMVIVIIMFIIGVIIIMLIIIIDIIFIFIIIMFIIVSSSSSSSSSSGSSSSSLPERREAPRRCREIRISDNSVDLRCCFLSGALFGWHYLSNATCLICHTASCVLCAVYSVKDHHDLLDCSPLLKNTCVRQVVLDKWFPLNSETLLKGLPWRLGDCDSDKNKYRRVPTPLRSTSCYSVACYVI